MPWLSAQWRHTTEVGTVRYWALSSGRKILSRIGNTVEEQEKRMVPLLSISQISRAFFSLTTYFLLLMLLVLLLLSCRSKYLIGQLRTGCDWLPNPAVSTDPLVLSKTNESARRLRVNERYLKHKLISAECTYMRYADIRRGLREILNHDLLFMEGCTGSSTLYCTA